jgi:ferrous iron transport protein A
MLAVASPSFLAMTAVPEPGTVSLGAARVGFRGRIRAIRVVEEQTGLPPGELERRLVELGFVEGARVEILHQGLFGGDPIAVRLNEATIALRRREAAAILVVPVAAPPADLSRPDSSR